MIKYTITGLLLLTLSLVASAEVTKTVYNPNTNKPDYITVLTSVTLPGGSTQYIQNRSTLQSGATAYIDFLEVGSTSTFHGPIKIDDSTVFQAVSVSPPQPPAGSACIHATTTNGFTRLDYDNESQAEYTLGRDNVILVRNNSGGILTPLQPVYINGATGNVPQVGLALASSSGTLPAIGVVISTIASNGYGEIMKLGNITNVNTASFAVGDQLWVSTYVAGGLTNVLPAYPNLSQKVGSVLVSGVGNGTVYVTITPAVHGMENGTISRSYTFAGDATVSNNLVVSSGANITSAFTSGTPGTPTTIASGDPNTVALVTKGNTFVNPAVRIANAKHYIADLSQQSQTANNPTTWAPPTSTSDFSVALWVKWDYFGQVGNPAIIGTMGGAGFPFWYIYTNQPPTPLILVFAFKNDSLAAQQVIYSSSIVTNQWYFIYAAHDQTNHVNTISVNNANTITAAHSGGELTLSAAYPGTIAIEPGLNYSSSTIAAVGIWGRKLTPTEVTSIYNSGNGKLFADLSSGEKTGLQSWYDLQSNTNDSIGGFNLSDVNGPINYVNGVNNTPVPQVSNLQQWQNSAGTVLADIAASGQASFPSATIGSTTPVTTSTFNVTGTSAFSSNVTVGSTTTILTSTFSVVGTSNFSSTATFNDDIIFSGANSGIPYGMIFSSENVVNVTTMTNQGQYYQITSMTSTGPINVITPVAPTSLKIIKAGTYLITATISFQETGGAISGDNLEFMIFKNNGTTELNHIQSDFDVPAIGTQHQVVLTGLATLAVNDTIEIWVRDNTTAGQKIIPRDVDFSIMMVGG